MVSIYAGRFTTMKPWPRDIKKTNESIVSALNYMVRARKDDITEFDNLGNVFISGRKVDRIPTGSTDIVATDSVGDFNYDENYIYILVIDGSSNIVWRRASLGSW